MSIPRILEQSTDGAYVAMMAHPERALVPIQRYGIYEILNRIDPSHERLVFKRLAIITVRYLLSSYKFPLLDKLPADLIKMAEGRMNETISVAMAYNEAEKAWVIIENMAANNSNVPGDIGLFNVYVAAHEALMEVLGRNPFDEIIVDQNSTDPDLDPWCSDTALWAAAAYSGMVGDPGSDVFKRQEFWEWWLQEAIPAAWSIGNKMARVEK